VGEGSSVVLLVVVFVLVVEVLVDVGFSVIDSGAEVSLGFSGVLDSTELGSEVASAVGSAVAEGAAEETGSALWV
jgi:hypothetical protein